MEFYQKTAKNGVVCNYGYTDHFKSSYVSLDFIMPLTEENATGMSLLAGVIGRGCAKYPQMDQIGRYLARNYGASFSISANKAGEFETLSFSFTHLDNDYAIDGEDISGAIFSLLNEMVFHPLIDGGAFLSSYVEQEKTNLNDKIIGQFNDKRVYSLERCKSLMCSEEAYGVNEMGSCDIIKEFTPVSLYSFYRRMMADACVVINYVGKERTLDLLCIADKFTDRSSGFPSTQVLTASTQVNEVIEEMDLNQSKLNLGFRLGDTAVKKGAACRLFNVLYGGSATSKLFMNVRERLSLCYYCSSTVDRFKNVMFVSSGVESVKYNEARNEIEAQLAAIACGAFTDEELSNARVYLCDSIRGFLDSEGALASMMLSGTLRGELKTPEQEIKEIEKVTREDLIAIAKETVLDTVYFLKGVHNEA